MSEDAQAQYECGELLRNEKRFEEALVEYRAAAAAGQQLP